ncbi:MAG: hypothetical protein H7Y02_03045 [Candidatus Obscuribacterales bacterium]|nr:hypothetical protein [Steroidobacteraceae bacterium]
MSDWSNNNLAHRHTWMGLIVLRELNNKTFDKAGALLMNSLASWSDLDSATMRATKSNTLAAQIDNIFRLFQGAQYESGITRAAAVKCMSTVLQTRSKTVKELGHCADDCYRFKNEQPP